MTGGRFVILIIKGTDAGSFRRRVLVRKLLLASIALLSIFSNGILAQKPKPATSKSPAATAAPRPAYAIPFVSKTLPNGLEVIVLQDTSVPIVTVELAVRNGSFTEPLEFNGLSHLYEHMFFKPNFAVQIYGCEHAARGMGFAVNPGCVKALAMKSKIGDTSYLKDADEVSIYNGTTNEEIVNYFFNTTSQYLPTAIRFINDSVRYPSFGEEDFENEKRVVIGELDRHEANPYGYLDLTMTQKLFYKYPTRKQPAGTRETVAAATTDMMRTIQSRYYVPNNAALIVTGDAKPDEVFKLAEQIFGSWERRPVDPFKDFPLVDHPPLQKSEAVIIEKTATGEEGADQGQNVFVEIGWLGPSIGKDDAATYAADVFSYIITQPDARFERKLVDSGLSASTGFSYYTQRNVGPIKLLAVTTPEKAKQFLAATYAEINDFTRPDYFTDEELESAKTLLETSDLFNREKASEYAHTLSFWWSSTGIEYFRNYHAKLRAVTRADINRYIKTYIQGKNHVAITLASPDAKKRAGLTEQDLIGGGAQ